MKELISGHHKSRGLRNVTLTLPQKGVWCHLVIQSFMLARQHELDVLRKKRTIYSCSVGSNIF